MSWYSSATPWSAQSASSAAEFNSDRSGIEIHGGCMGRQRSGGESLRGVVGLAMEQRAPRPGPGVGRRVRQVETQLERRAVGHRPGRRKGAFGYDRVPAGAFAQAPAWNDVLAAEPQELRVEREPRRVVRIVERAPME